MGNHLLCLLHYIFIDELFFLFNDSWCSSIFYVIIYIERKHIIINVDLQSSNIIINMLNIQLKYNLYELKITNLL